MAEKRVYKYDTVSPPPKFQLNSVQNECDEFRQIYATSRFVENPTFFQLEQLILAYNDIQDRLYEIDKSWKNNLIFYGIPAGKADSLGPELDSCHQAAVKLNIK